MEKESGDDFARNKTMRQYNNFQAIQSNYIYICNIIYTSRTKYTNTWASGTQEKKLIYI